MDDRHSRMDSQDVLRQHVWKEEEEDDERQLSLNHKKPEPPQVKEEELSPSEDGQLLELKRETDMTAQVKSKDKGMTKYLSQNQICQQQLCKQESSSNLDLEEKQPRSIKEEEAEEELLSRHEAQQPVVKQDMDTLTVTPYYGEAANIKTEPRSMTIAAESQVLEGQGYTEIDLDEKEEPVSGAGSLSSSDKDRELCVCQTCGKSFKNNSSLKVHTGERPYTCETCRKSFTQHSTFAYHTTVHTDERPYSCSKCGKCFSQRGTLNVHMRTHTEASFVTFVERLTPGLAP